MSQPAFVRTVVPAPVVVRTVSAPIVKTHTYAVRAPVVKTVVAPAPVLLNAPVVKTVAPAPVLLNAPVVKTVAPAPVLLNAPVVKTVAPAPVLLNAPVVKTSHVFLNAGPTITKSHAVVL